MKQIQPVTIWKNGEQKIANYLNAYIVNDNLKDNVTFYYALVNQEVVDENPITIELANGNISLSGEEYDNWGASGDINEEAYVILAEKLNLVLI